RLSVEEAGRVAAAAGAGAEAAGHDELAGLAQARPASAQTPPRTGAEADPPPTATGKRPSVSSTRPSGDLIPGPAWEGMRRYEAYPTIRSRGRRPGVPRG